MDANRRILIVDDQEDLRLQVAKMLQAKAGGSATSSLIDQIRSRISKNKEPASGTVNEIEYTVDTVGQGRDAYEMVKESFSRHQPYALMFLDMRMPPGWDGLETAQRIRSIDKEIQIVIMTAYADHEQREIAEKVGEPDKLLYIKKPFHPEEIRQLALAMTEKWNMNRREKDRLILTNRLMRENSFLTRHRFKNIKDTYRTILDAFISFLDARSGVLIQRTNDKHVVCNATSAADGERLKNSIPDESKNSAKIVTDEQKGTAFFPVMFEGFDGYIFIEGKNLVFPFAQLRSFLDILLETAREVLINAFLHQQQTAERQLAAVGMATSKINKRFREAVVDIRNCADQLEKAENQLARSELSKKIHYATEAVLRLTDEISIFSEEQVRDLNLRKHLVDQLISNAIKRVKPGIDRMNIELKLSLTEGLAITCDKESVEKIVESVLLNSIEAITRRIPDELKIEVSAAYLNNFRNAVSITVTDTGGGIPGKVLGRVFEPFVSTVPEVKNGLGMTIAKQLIDRHNGILAYTTEEEKGTTFQIVLPISPDAQISGSVSGKLS